LGFVLARAKFWAGWEGGKAKAQKLDEWNFLSNTKFFPANPLKNLKAANEKFGKTCKKLDDVKLFS